MALVEMKTTNEKDFLNKEKIYKIVENHFHLNEESLIRFKQLLFNPKMDEKFIPLLDDCFRYKKEFLTLEEKEKSDTGFIHFKKALSDIGSSLQVTYEEFVNNKITIGGQEYKLFKYLIDAKIFCPSMLDKISSLTLPKREILPVISFNFVDWFLCSTGETWGSCLNLESNYSSCFWAGLPGLVGDFNRFLFYTTDGNFKQYKGIETYRFLSRAWGLLDENDKFLQLKSYPTYVDFIKLFNLTEVEYKTRFVSKYSIERINDINNNSIFIFQDNTGFGNDGKIIANKYGYEFFSKEEGRLAKLSLLQYTGGLCKLIDLNKNLKEYLDDNVCVKCKKVIYEELVIDDEYYCEDCYDDFACSCEVCGKKLHANSDSLYRNSDGEIYCERCYYERYTSCNSCGMEVYLDDSYYADDNHYCESCFHDNYSICNDCGKTISNDESHDFDDSVYCERCYDRRFTDCEQCGEAIEKSDSSTIEHEGNYYCEDCFHKIFVVCKECETIIEKNKNNLYQFNYYCDDCLEEITKEEEAISS